MVKKRKNTDKDKNKTKKEEKEEKKLEPPPKIRKIKPTIVEDEPSSDDDGGSSDDDEYEPSEHEYTEKDIVDDDDYSINMSDEEEKIEDPLIRAKFIEVRKELEAREIHAKDILLSPIKTRDKATLFELYEVLRSTDPRSEEYINMKSRVSKLYRQFLAETEELAKLNAIQQEKLNKDDTEFKNKMKSDITRQNILEIPTDEENKMIILDRYKEFTENKINRNGEESAKMGRWLKLVMQLPFDRVKELPITPDKIPELLFHVKQILDEELFGMQKVKEQLLLFLNSKLRNTGIKGTSAGLIGGPGTGKTAVVRALARALDYPFYQISFGGIKDPSWLTGHDYCYVGSDPGIISKALMHNKFKNGIVFLDEFEKVSDCKEIITTLLHIIDPVQNMEFKDHYFSNVKIDLSSIWWIFSMNTMPEDSALKDRVFYINVPAYSFEEKIKILTGYLLPKAIKNIGLKKEDVLLEESVARYLVEKISGNEEEGVRSIEKEIKNIVNKLYFIVANQNTNVLLTSSLFSFDFSKNLKFPTSITKDMVDKLSETGKTLQLNMYI